MSTDQDIGGRLKIAREKAGYKSAAKAAEALGMSYPTYAGHENGTRGLRKNIERYAQFYRVSVDWLLTAKGEGPKNGQAMRGPMPPPGQVRLMGRVGAGQVFTPFDDDSVEYVEAPEGVPPSTEAVEVDGNSMFPAYEHRSLIYYSKILPPEMMVNRRAVIRLADGSMTVKVLRMGSEPGLWTLQSINAQYEDMTDKAVEWAAPIDWVKPR
jgi:phage repressor protein C with HTH and peptisase S24 domain